MNVAFTCTSCGGRITVDETTDEPSLRVTCDCGERYAVTISSLTVAE
jgi:hypothetical protein